MQLYESMAGRNETLSAVPPNKSPIESFSFGKPPVARNSGGTLSSRPQVDMNCLSLKQSGLQPVAGGLGGGIYFSRRPSQGGHTTTLHRRDLCMTPERISELRSRIGDSYGNGDALKECLDEIGRLQTENAQFLEALAHYKNHPPPHPETTLDVIGSDQCRITVTRQILP